MQPCSGLNILLKAPFLNTWTAFWFKTSPFWYSNTGFAQSKMIFSRAWLHDTVPCAAWNDTRKGLYLQKRMPGKSQFTTSLKMQCFWGALTKTHLEEKYVCFTVFSLSIQKCIVCSFKQKKWLILCFDTYLLRTCVHREVCLHAERSEAAHASFCRLGLSSGIALRRALALGRPRASLRSTKVTGNPNWRSECCTFGGSDCERISPIVSSGL